MVEQEKKIDDLMTRRVVPPMSSNLSQRIIDAAKNAPQSPPQGSWLDAARLKFSALFQGEYMPQPAFIVAGVLVLGVAAGVLLQDMTKVPEEDLIFLYVENSFLFEDWL